MKHIVVGGAGFIGSNLVDKLIEKKHEVIIIDNFSTGKKENINPQAQVFEFDMSDNRNCSKFTDIMKDADTVFLLAAKARVQPSILNPVDDITDS